VDQLTAPPQNAWLMDPLTQWWSRWMNETDQLATLHLGGHVILLDVVCLF
jgi:hypothetical protein